MDLQQYLTEGVENVVRDAIRATLKNSRESAFMLQFSKAAASASKCRERNEKEGLHVPSYLIEWKKLPTLQLSHILWEPDG